jgi:hypothetical protein
MSRGMSDAAFMRAAARFLERLAAKDAFVEADRARRKVRAEQAPPKDERPRCGARCRDGHACRARVVVTRNELGGVVVRSRCRMHGGLSTGARTAEGKARLREAGRRGAAERWRRWREARGTAE